MHKKCQCKNTMQNKYKSKIIYCINSKTQIAENVFGHPLDSHLGGVQDMQSRLLGFHAFKFFLSLHQHLNRDIIFQERAGGWHSPPAQVPNAAFRERGGGHFPGDEPTEGPFFLLFFVFLFFVSFFFPVFYLSCFAISFKKYPVLVVPNSDRGPSLSAGQLSIWQAWASTLGVFLRLHGFTSDFPFQV